MDSWRWGDATCQPSAPKAKLLRLVEVKIKIGEPTKAPGRMTPPDQGPDGFVDPVPGWFDEA